MAQKKTKSKAAWGLLPWSTDGKPPKEFRLFKYGENRSTKGTVYLTRESANKCLSSWIDYGNDLSGDYNHAITNPQIENPKASCWFHLALKQDGLYAVDVRWTAAASAMIEAKEHRYYSPYFVTEQDKNNRPCVVEIINVALTITPATKNQRPLVALSKQAWSINNMFDQKQIDALKALLIDGGVEEAKASDLILSMQSILCASMPEEMPADPGLEMPLADEMPADEKPTDIPMGEQYKKAFALLENQVKALTSEISSFKASKAKEEKDAKEQLFVQFKREGRLAYVKEADARELLNTNVDLFKRTFGNVTPLTQKAPAAPALKSVSEIAKTQPSADLVAPAPTSDEIQTFMARPENKDLSFKQALVAFSRTAKGVN